MQRHQKVLKYVLARKHSRWEESFKKLKHALHKDEKIEVRFSLDLDKIREYISDKGYYYEFNYSQVQSV